MRLGTLFKDILGITPRWDCDMVNFKLFSYSHINTIRIARNIYHFIYKIEIARNIYYSICTVVAIKARSPVS